MERKFRSFYIGALAVIGVGLLGTVLVPKAHADVWDKETIVTVDEPMIAGNEVLQPGTYVWKLLNSPSNRHTVQIFNRDQHRLESTIPVTPNYRLQPAGKSQFAYWETPASVPKAIRAWFYPGDRFGLEFAYPKKLVTQLASVTPTPIARSETQPFIDHSTTAPLTKSLSYALSSSALIGLVGLGFISLSGLISLFANRNA